jgi:hypothetical protein
MIHFFSVAFTLCVIIIVIYSLKLWWSRFQLSGGKSSSSSIVGSGSASNLSGQEEDAVHEVEVAANNLDPLEL